MNSRYDTSDKYRDKAREIKREVSLIELIELVCEATDSYIDDECNWESLSERFYAFKNLYEGGWLRDVEVVCEVSGKLLTYSCEEFTKKEETDELTFEDNVKWVNWVV